MKLVVPANQKKHIGKSVYGNHQIMPERKEEMNF